MDKTTAWVATSLSPDLVPDTLVPVTVGDHSILVLRRGDRILAFDALCPHKFGPLVDGTLEGDGLTCPIHDATFDVQTGEPREDCAWAGRLPTYAVRVEGDVLAIELPES